MLEAEETRDRLAGEWWIYQLRGGNRYTTDDVLLAWYGWRTRPQARRLLDLGAGVGSVGLMLLLKMTPLAHLTTIEIQPVSVGLQHKTVCENGLEQRVDIRQGDLRSPLVMAPEESFDLIVANPPYLTQGQALRSPQPQRAAARMELHGDIFDYCRVAAHHLEREGCFCFSHAAGDSRPAEAIAKAGLVLLSRRDVIFREGERPVIALFACGWAGSCRNEPPLTTRRMDGQRTDEFRRLRVEMLIEA